MDPIQINQITFVFLASGLILLAWSAWKRWFLEVFLIASLIMLASWLSPQEGAALLGFLIPPYLLTRLCWGKNDRPWGLQISLLVTWEIALFIYLRGYEWVEYSPWLVHPLAIIGLSYMLFRVIHLAVNAPHLGEYPISLTRYFSYVGAFWTLLSGPIQSYDSFCRGLTEIGRPETNEILRQAHRATNGLIKAFFIAPIFLKSSELGINESSETYWIDFAVVFYSYPIYLYLNFSGYTDVVIAISRMCGMTTMPENFNRPYMARNIQDFWTRWHISFGVWIRQYVFNPLSKILLKAFGPNKSNLALAIVVLITFILVGAWHGTTANFIVFGLLHGMAVIITVVYGSVLKKILGKQKRKKFENNILVKSISIFLCFHFVCFTILLFTNQVQDVLAIFQRLIIV
jgi:D-alanyl-lipoteichoic acid acyltransferase DltB (MBOAT superfamily)